MARAGLAGAAVLALAACDGQGVNFNALDWDLRSRSAGLNTAEAARNATTERPRADTRGVISYPGYQVVVAGRGESVTTVASRLGVDAMAMARLNAIPHDAALNGGEVLLLPSRVSEPPASAAPAGFGQPLSPATTGTDVGAIATTALDRVDSTAPPRAAAPAAPAPAAAPEPRRHRVARGETAFGIARLYNVSPRSLAEWNGLGPNLSLREGQTLLIPPLAADGSTVAAPASAPPPGAGSPTPVPPSATQPLPANTAAAATARATPGPASPDLGSQRTAASAAKFAMPADGRIIRAYAKGRYDGVGIGASAGSAVRAADDGTVAAITRDTEQVPIVVLRHAGGLLTVYANVDGISVKKDDTVKRGQQIGKVRSGNPAFLHFEVRRGTDSLDPMTFLQ
jgi:murein DD-endopeptidase MepM/ murein hydrolase activator NlpD